MKRNAWVLYAALGVVSALGLSGCASSKYLQLTPVTGDVAHVEGRMVTKAEVDSLVVVASFEREDMEYLAMDIEIKNKSSRPVRVDPVNFRYVALTASEDTLRESHNPALVVARTAADPTAEGERVKSKVAREERRLKTARIINTVLLVATVASDISSSTRRQSVESRFQNRVAHNNAYQLIQAKRVIDHGVFADRMQQYGFETYRWSELALQRTYIEPGESVRGFVYLPKANAAQFIRLNYPVSEQSQVSLVFSQEMVSRKR